MDTKVLVDSVDVRNPILFTSFPGIGLVGTIASTHFITELNLDWIGVIESKDLPPIATLMDGIILPPIRVYQSMDFGFVLIHSDVPILPHVAYEMSEEIVNWAMEIDARRIYSLAGVTTFEDKRRVFGVATSKELLEEIRGYVEIFKSGTISGIAGSILNECVARKFPGLALLGETLGFNPDPRAAAEVINVLNRIFGWEIGVEKLIKEAELIEAQMQKLAEQTKMHEVGKEKLPMYG
ncbi:MAG: proteasome assembly chaperone family protein [Archaeoglobales archaeon]|nr:MAG: proteasome assembly chaperone family protein [Archaeoglobales archaeon]